MKHALATAALGAALCAPAALALAADPAPAYPPFGFDLTARDPAVKPGTDFFLHANGRYVARTPIPADDVVASRRSGMTREIDARLHAILDEAARDVAPQPADVRGKVGAFYAAFMDEARIEQLGAKPIAPELEAIRAAPDLAALATLMGRSALGFQPTVFSVSIDSDLKRPDRYAVYLNQSGLGLPDIDYYTQPAFAAQRGAYRAYAARLLQLLGWPDAEAAAAEILAFETRIAQASWSNVQQRDVVAQYNPVTPAELEKLAPEFPWHEFLQAAQLGDKPTLVAAQNTAFPKIAAITRATPLPTLKAWMAFRAADAAAPYLPAAFAGARFELRNHVLGGQQEQQPRWKRGVAAVAGRDCLIDPQSCFGTLKWAVGQLYAERWFPPATKAKMTELAGNLKSAFRRRMQGLAWMGAETKAEALKKLDAVSIKVGYPDSWRDYGNVAIRRDDLVGDVRAAAAADWQFILARSSGPVDRNDWSMTPQTNDAYAGSLLDIVFPAGILQPPIFDAAADPALNYGAAGAVIGHELTHQFDDQGRTVDSAGVLRDWWTPADAEAFKARAAVLGAQYARYEPVPGVHINPGLTMGENLADLGGVSIALDAYHASLGGRPAPVLGGLTGDQRVFLGWAQAWAGKARPEEIRRLTTSDPHSFRSFRVNGVVRNIDAWYVAFGVKRGDRLWIAPEERARVW
jgi:putative endopeptidase